MKHSLICMNNKHAQLWLNSTLADPKPPSPKKDSS